MIQFAKWREEGNRADDNGCPNTREALCWRLDDGAYGVAALNGAWWGWQQGRAHGDWLRCREAMLSAAR